MTTHSSPRPVARHPRPTGRAAAVALVLAVLAGLAWTVAMIYTLLWWAL
ncbi:morphogenic membrane protein MmpA [Streptomyces sp. NPDC004752]